MEIHFLEGLGAARGLRGQGAPAAGAWAGSGYRCRHAAAPLQAGGRAPLQARRLRRPPGHAPPAWCPGSRKLNRRPQRPPPPPAPADPCPQPHSAACWRRTPAAGGTRPAPRRGAAPPRPRCPTPRCTEAGPPPRGLLKGGGRGAEAGGRQREAAARGGGAAVAQAVGSAQDARSLTHGPSASQHDCLERLATHPASLAADLSPWCLSAAGSGQTALAATQTTREGSGLGHRRRFGLPPQRRAQRRRRRRRCWRAPELMA